MSARDDYTIALPPCATHPPLSEWPMKNLLTHTCPACGASAYGDRPIGRMVRAWQLIREAEAGHGGPADRERIACPRAKSWMTPCIARDGSTALDDGDVCVGCGAPPRTLLVDLAKRFRSGRRYVQTKDPRSCADRFASEFAAYVEAREPDQPPSKPSTRVDR